MFAIDFHIHEIKARHRVSLFSLIKLGFGDLEPCFSKIITVRDALDPTTRQGQPFGFVALIRADIFETMNKSFDKVVLKAEVYHNREELALICSGHTEVSLSQPVRLRSRLSAGLSSQKFINIATSGEISIPMFHKAQNKSQISAGHINMSVDIYEINLKVIINPSLAPVSSHIANVDVDNCHGQSVTVAIPAPVALPLYSPTASVSVDSAQNDEADINTTKEDIDYLKDDYDPIDDFVHDFLSACPAPPNQQPIIVAAEAPLSAPLFQTTISRQPKDGGVMHSRSSASSSSAGRARFSGGNSMTSQSTTVTGNQPRTITASRQRPSRSSASGISRTNNYGRGLSLS